MEATGATVDVRELETKVKDMYRHVAKSRMASTTSSWAGPSPSTSAIPARSSIGSRMVRSSPSPGWATSSTSPT